MLKHRRESMVVAFLLALAALAGAQECSEKTAIDGRDYAQWIVSGGAKQLLTGGGQRPAAVAVFERFRNGKR